MDHNASFVNEVVELITCNICREFIGVEIFQCPMGHIYCFRCARHLNSCAVCRSPMPNGGARTGIRNRALEKLLNVSGNLPCLQENCDKMLPFSQFEDHYVKCEHRIIGCPSYGCSWTGKISRYVEHIIGDHQDVQEIKSGKVELRLKNPSGLLINAYAEQLIKHRENFFLFAVWLIKGQRAPSSLTFGIVHLSRGDEDVKVSMKVSSRFNNCNFTCDRTPWNLSDNIQDVRRSSHNLILDWSLVLRIGESDTLYRDLDQLKLEPRSNSLDLPITLTFSDCTGKLYTRGELFVEPLVVNFVDIEEEEHE